LTLHCPLNEKTKGMVSSERLNLMKSDAILINTSRGGVVDEKALFHALIEGRIRGAALDVFEIEPAEDSPLFKLNNCLLSPHVAWASQEAQKRLLDGVVSNLESFVLGIPKNVIKEAGPHIMVPQRPINRRRFSEGSNLEPSSFACATS
jgi:glycerate dehydrogenase